MIAIHDLVAGYGGRDVLHGCSFTATPGVVTALVGPNGCGKTTLIKTLLGLVRPTSGVVQIAGRPVGTDPAYRAAVGYMPQRPHYPGQLSAGELLRLLETLRGTEATDRDLVAAFGMTKAMDAPLRTLSGGTLQKVAAVVAFLFEPEVLILDEPTAGLDPVAATVFKQKLLASRDRGASVLLTSHLVAEIEALADDLVFMAEGSVVHHGPVAALKQQAGTDSLEAALALLMHRHYQTSQAA